MSHKYTVIKNLMNNENQLNMYKSCIKFFGASFSGQRSELRLDSQLLVKDVKTRKGGIKTLPFIIANESFEKLVSYGLLANMILYLISQYNLSSASGASILFMWSAVGNFMPLIGAFISDSYLGRFRVIAIGTIIGLAGVILLVFTAIFKDARPPSCDQRVEKCIGPNKGQLMLLMSSFVLMGIGSGGVRPCSIAFGADQIDNPTNHENKRALQSYFSLYYSSIAVSILISVSLMVYIQDKFGWVVGFAILAGLMFLSTILFLVGSPLYIKFKASRSLFTSFSQVLTAAFKNKHLAFPSDDSDGMYLHSGSKFIFPTEKLRFLNKACIIRNPEKNMNSNEEGEDAWRVCTVEQVEEFKALIKVLPIWSTGIMISVTVSQQAFPVLQARTMDRRFITNGFEIPAGSYGLFALITLTIWVPLYDRVLIPLLAKFTKHKHGLTLKQRMGLGLFVSSVAMLMSGIVEKQRREKAIEQGLINNPLGIVNMSGSWLVPQYCLLGLAEAFNAVGQIEFFYSQFPKSMSSIGLALFNLGGAVGNLAAGLVVKLVDDFSKSGGKAESWVSDNINKGHYDYYYYLLAGLSALNFFYFLLCSCLYGPSEENMNKEEHV